jgi:hypothetical protein
LGQSNTLEVEGRTFNTHLGDRNAHGISVGKHEGWKKLLAGVDETISEWVLNKQDAGRRTGISW